MIVMWDDHEIANDSWREGAENHDNSEGAVRGTSAAGPPGLPGVAPHPGGSRRPRTDATGRMRFGDLAELWMLDERRYRDAPPTSGLFSLASVDPAIEAPGTLDDRHRAAGVVDRRAEDEHRSVEADRQPGADAAAEHRTRDTERAQGRTPSPHREPADQPTRLLHRRLERLRRRADDPVSSSSTPSTTSSCITGDYHESFASDLPADLGAYVLDGHSVAVEFVAPSVTSPGYAEVLAARSPARS